MDMTTSRGPREAVLFCTFESKIPSLKAPASLEELPLPLYPERCAMLHPEASRKELAFSLGPTPGSRVREVSPEGLGQGLEGGHLHAIGILPPGSSVPVPPFSFCFLLFLCSSMATVTCFAVFLSFALACPLQLLVATP